MQIRRVLTLPFVVGLIVAGFIANGPSGYAQAQPLDETIQVIGKGVLSGKDPTGAREAAIADAILTAVGFQVLRIVPTEIITSRFDAVTAMIDKQAETFVTNYKVLAEKVTDSEYRVLIEAVISEAQLQAAIDQEGLLRQEKSLPSLLFLIAEQNVNENSPQFWWRADAPNEAYITEAVLIQEMGAKGYAITDRTTPFNETGYGIDLSAASAAEIGQRYQADVVITGKAVAITAKETGVTDLKTYQGTLTVRAYRADTGAQIGISHADMISVNKDDATGGRSVLSLVAKQVAADLAPQLDFHQNRLDDASPNSITIEVSGTDHLRRFVTLRRLLNAMPNTEKVQIKALTPPTAILVVQYRGSGANLSAEIKKAAADVISIQIQELPLDRLKVSLTP